MIDKFPQQQELGLTFESNFPEVKVPIPEEQQIDPLSIQESLSSVKNWITSFIGPRPLEDLTLHAAYDTPKVGEVAVPNKYSRLLTWYCEQSGYGTKSYLPLSGWNAAHAILSKQMPEEQIIDPEQILDYLGEQFI